MNHHNGLPNCKLESSVVRGVMGAFGITGGREQTMANNRPAGMKPVDKGCNVRVDQARRTLQTMVGNIEG